MDPDPEFPNSRAGSGSGINHSGSTTLHYRDLDRVDLMKKFWGNKCCDTFSLKMDTF